MTDQNSSTMAESGSSRTASFMRQDRESGLHPAVKSLHERPAARSESANRRAVEYARIERGHRV